MSEYTAYFSAQMVGDADVLRRMRLLEQEAKILKRYENLRINVTGNTANIEKSLDDINQRLQVLQQTIDKQYSLKVDTSNAETGVTKFQSMLEGLGGILDTIGGKLQSLGGIFGGNLMDMVGRRLVTMGTRSLVSGMERSVSRYDILKTFPMYAEAVGTDSERAAEMVQELNEAVLGLPTGLDEIVDSAKQYGILLDDLERGKELAISMNNALLASGASEAMQTSAEYEVFRLLTSGTLATSRQWRTLFQGLGAARQYIAKEMGYDDVTKWQNDLMGIAPNGATSEEKEAVKALATELQGEFIDALVKAGQGEGVMSLVEIYKSTLESSLANVKNALANLGASVLDEIDNVLKEETGTGLVDTIVSFSDTIKQSFIPAVRDWLRENPDVITDFLDKIKNYDWGTLFENIGKFASTYAEVLGTILTAIPPEATAFLMTLASPVGKGLSLLGGFFQLLASIKIGSGSFLGKLGTAGGAAEMGNVGASLARFFSSLAKVAGFVAVVAEIGAVVYEFGKIAESISNMKISSSFGKNMQTILEVLGVVSAFAVGLTASAGVINMLTGGAGGFLALGGAAGFTGLVAMMGGVIYEFALIAEKISGLNITSDFGAKCERIAKGIGGLALVVGALSAAASTFALPVLIGEGVLITIGNTLKDLLGMADTVKELANTNLSDSQIERAATKAEKMISSLGTMFKSMKEAFDSDTMWGLIWDRSSSNSMASIVENMTEMINNLVTATGSFVDIEANIDKLEESVVGPNGMIMPTRLEKISKGVTDVITVLGEMFNNMKYALSTSINGVKTPESMVELWFDRSSSNSMISIVTNLTGVVGELDTFTSTVLGMEGKLQTLNSREVPGHVDTVTVLDKIKGHITTVATAIGELFQSLKDDFTGTGRFASLGIASTETSTIGLILENMNTSITAVGDIAQSIMDVESTLKSVLEGANSAGEYVASLGDPKSNAIIAAAERNGYMKGAPARTPLKKSPLYNVTEMLEQFYQEITDFFTQIRQFSGGTQDAIDAATSLSSLNEAIGYFFEIMTSIQTNTELIEGLTSEGAFPLGGKLNTIASYLHDIFARFDFGDLAPSDITAAAQGLETAMGNVLNIATSLSANQEAINGLFDDKDWFTLGSKINEILTSLRRAFEALTSGSLDFANLPDQVGNVSKAIDAMGGEGGIFGKLKALEQTVNGFFGEGDTFQLGERLNTVFGSLNSVLTDVDTTKTAMPIAGFQGFAGQIDNLNTSFQNLSSQGVEQATGSLEDSAEAMDNAKAAADRLKGALQGLMSTYSTTAGSAGSMISSMYAIMSALNAAATSARNLASAINSIPTQKSISVNYSQSGSISSALGRLAARGHFSKGGRVAYRAYGGSIFRPRGTDTVPAMLTPGEYVMRRAVVNAYGSRFFQNLNNLNLAGALTSLTRRAGAYITPRGSGITNNYNRDNHAQVTQHIHTNNTNYALKRANRWVNAL